jgi:hypothetical protein
MEAPQFEDPSLDRRGHLVRTGVRPGTAVDEAAQTFGRVPPQPAVHGLAAHPIATRHVGHRCAVFEDLQHGLIPLFHETQLD